ncbi:MAG: kelch repeat-containing protein, partial [Actinomycetota bacterium]
EEYDRTTGRFVDRALIPTPRHHVAAVASPTHVYVTGGRRPNPGGGSDVNVAAFDRYNVAEDRWERLPNVPTARSGHGAGLVDGKVVVLGGEDPSAGGSPSIAETEEYDIGRNIWGRSYPGMFRPRHGVAAVTIGNDIYVFLGASRAALAPTASSDVLLTP